MRKFFVALLTVGLPLASSFPASDSHSAKFAENPVSPEVDCQSHLLEIGRPPKTQAATNSAPDIKIVSYNIRWRSGEDLHQLAQLLRDDPEIGGAVILGLQEVDRNKKRSGNRNSAAMLAEELGMYYAWAAPPPPKNEKEEETGVAILSAYPLTDARRLVLPHKGPGGRRRVALGATVKLGTANVRVYSVHSETRIPVGCKLQQMKAVLNDLARYSKDMPVVVLGDLNTWEPAAVAETFKLFAAENFHTPFDDQPTFYRRALFIPIDLKLDWIWLRNLESTSNGIDRTIKLSDHFPLWINLRRPGTPIGSSPTKQ
ncbi:MAG TPA: endonuclease/exonuclease/phosphatase family protein [Pyrinomonadaceae bacterium]|jgi:endonuclease/exonuclease/phosphatase family metal-dependent hydrolase